MKQKDLYISFLDDKFIEEFGELYYERKLKHDKGLNSKNKKIVKQRFVDYFKSHIKTYNDNMVATHVKFCLENLSNQDSIKVVIDKKNNLNFVYESK
jgi:hypothetical protein